MSTEPIWRGSIENKLLRYGITPLIAIIFAFAYVLNDSASVEKQIVVWGWFYFGSVMLFAYVAVITFSKLNVEVRDSGFFIRYGYWIYPVQKIDWNNVASVRLLQVEPTEWG
ncbi:MAG: hypothetical protein NT032_03945 [Actinobacteria bacterium]|nr:hypothetical protein [Actinomycetota bacterium]